MQIATGLKYLVLSSFTVEDVQANGTVIIRQKVEGTRLLEADAMAQSVFGDLLKKLAGETFQLTLNPHMQIVDLYADEGAFPVATGGNPMAGQPLMMASLVDRDGWRELNQLTFFQPERTLKKEDRWQHPLTHSWGPLGSWEGQANFRYDGERDGLSRVLYDLKLYHKAPDRQANTPLPFRPSEAKFQNREGRRYNPLRPRTGASRTWRPKRSTCAAPWPLTSSGRRRRSALWNNRSFNSASTKTDLAVGDTAK